MSAKNPQDPQTSAIHDDGHRDARLEALCAAANALRTLDAARVRARIPLEQVERELARVMHIELALLLVQARDLVLHEADSGPEASALVLALQEEARETIDVARACGVRVPRLVLRLLAGDPSTWPCASRLERLARRLEPDIGVAQRTHEAWSS